MKEKRDQRQNEKRVLPFEQYRHHFGEDGNDVGEKSVHQLLQHMRKMREAVPVNYQLQEELRKRLLEKQIKASNAEATIKQGTAGPVTNSSRSVPKLLWVCFSLLLLLIIALLIYNKTTDYSLQPMGTPKEVVKLWNADSNLSFSVVPNEGILIARHGQLLLSDNSVGQYRVLDMGTKWLYHSPAVSPSGEQVAMVRQKQRENPQIVAISMQKLKDSNQLQSSNEMTVLKSANNAEQYLGLTWSPDGTKLAYTIINKQNNAEVWLLEGQQEQFISAGINPTWSPDGTHLIIQRPINKNKDVLVLINPETGKEMLLGEGEQPVWGGNGYLAFVSTSQQERVLTFMPDGTPQFTVQQRVGEIRSVFAGNDGQRLLQELDKDSNWLALSTLLVNLDEGVGNKEMDWLRQMELQGVKEPRVLMLDEVAKCHNPVFGPDGKTLFYARQDQGTTTVLQVDVEERSIDQGVK